MSSGLQRRLLLLLLLPLLLLAALNTWFDFRSADSAALQQDRQLLNLVPLLADSVVARGETETAPPVLLTAPPVDEFLSARPGMSAFAVVGLDGRVKVGDDWLTGLPPTTKEAEFSSEEYEGVTYRIVSQRVKTVAGELVVRLADGSDPRQQWLRLLALKVLLPNLVLAVAGFFAVNWAVRTALRPLLELKDAVERRSPRDLSALDPDASPDEVRPLVLSLNRLFGLVNAQAESQARFVADAAHQLRTPLAGLQAQVEAWAQAVSGGRNAQNSPLAPVNAAPATITLGADQVLRLRQAARRTSQLANQLLALSRADSRSAQGQPMQRVDLKQLCEVVLEAQLEVAMRKDIDFGLDVAPAHVTGQEWLLRELLVNLVDNALKYTPQGGRVTLRCGVRAPQPGATSQPFLEVEDDGPGIPQAEQRRVLERFYRVPGTAVEGNGLGLAIADEIARVHRSPLQLGSGAAGRGLRVWLSLPA
ncbi:ATP-binding protein [Rhodoferax saidenbachensis]|uniref:histidine kinase n=1 Tax=Rhodoferax saidenbachensis TaxID=1484693 RepID=A0ABU1ZN89_9BURK|nr:ATP-binding protein [Rhodoferax saidenbachensis]MDR7306016.1 two-component system sensor histidine kinase TctE [Rhodoferax saidenbachensis]